MILNKILKEKHQVQRRLAKNSGSIHEYLKQAQKSAQFVSKKYGISLKYKKPAQNLADPLT